MGFFFAAFTAVLATILAVVMTTTVGHLPFIFALTSIFLTALYFSTTLGIVACALNLAGLCFVIFYPDFAFDIRYKGIAQIISFLLVSILVVWLTASVSGHARRLRRSKDELRVIVENVNEGLIVTDQDRNLLHVNRAARELLSIADGEELTKSEEFLNRFRMYDLQGNEIAQGERPLGRILRGEELKDFEVVFEPEGEGTAKILSLGGVLIDDGEGKYSYAVLVIRDITAQKKAQLAVRLRERQLSEIIETMKDALVTFSREGKILVFNSAAEKIFGYSSEEVVRRNAAMLVPSPLRNTSEDWVSTALASREPPAGTEFTGLTKNGEEVPIDVSFSRESIDAHMLFTLVIRDLTEKKGLESQLSQSQKMEAVGQLAGGIAHDFNNLLTAINGYADLALRTLSKDDAVRRYIESIRTASTSATELTTQLLAFSRKQVLRAKVLNLNEIVKRMEPLLSRLISRNIELRIDLDPQLGNIVADPGQLEQVIMNLVINARDAMPEGGVLGVSTRNAKGRERDFHISEEPHSGDVVILAVSDTGVGISEEVMERLFEPFFTTKETGKGTGLGLPTVHGIVLQSGGDIQVSSKVGEGSTFEIIFPKTDLEVAGTASEESEETGRPQGAESIAVVEDDPNVLELVRTILTGYGYSVVTFEDGRKALETLENGSPNLDLLLTDLELPSMNGRELASRVTATRPDMKVLLMSGYSHNPEAFKEHEAAKIPFISKPFSPEALAQKVREVLDS